MRIISVAILMGALCSHGATASAQACTASSSPVAFGSYNAFSNTARDTAGSVTVTCSALIGILVAYNIKLNGGMGGAIGTRRMRNGVSSLFYQLYTNAGRNIVWGDGTGGTQTITDGYLLSVGVDVIKTFPVYGRITALQNVTYGAYTDTVTILLTY
ncbi:MAG TPA: spore coat U domain-containing protein [Herbaspirillum sp.]|jgi:spore coat protein U-like protein